MKWVLVAQDKLCRHKLKGGLGLRDPNILSIVLGVKLWWRRLQGGMARWALWKLLSNWKYNNFPSNQLIILPLIQFGSSIWNIAKNGLHLIHQHYFGKSKMVNQLFYGGNYWKKLPKFNSLEQIEELKINMKYYHKHTTTNYWATDNS